MITLTTPPKVTAKLGSSAPADQVSYEKMTLSPFTLSPVDQAINGTFRLTSTSRPGMRPIMGALTISVPQSSLSVEVPQLDFYQSITLNSAQNTAVLNIIAAAQNSLEQGLIDLGLLAGVQSTGA